MPRHALGALAVGLFLAAFLCVLATCLASGCAGAPVALMLLGPLVLVLAVGAAEWWINRD